MSTPIDTNPRGGDGPNQDDAQDANSAPGASGEHRQDEGRGEGGGKEGGDAPKTASKGINPVQHSE
jgi:hypothetical protein